MDEIIKRARENLASDDHRVRMRAIEALGEQKDYSAVPLLIPFLRDRESLVRAAAVMALGDLGDRQAVEPLIECLKDRYSYVRANTVEALGKIGDLRMRYPLIYVLFSDPWYDVRRKALGMLIAHPDDRTVEVLIQALEDSDGDVRGNAAVALGEFGDLRAIPALEYMAATDGDEYWVPEKQWVTANSYAAREAIQAIRGRYAYQE